MRISEDSERELYDTLKHIYGSSFKLSDASEFKNKKSNLDGQYWMERGNLVIKGVVDYSSKTPVPKAEAQLTKHFATSKLLSYSFHSNHCQEALAYTDGDVGKALEILFEKYYKTKEIIPQLNNGLENFNIDDAMDQRSDEKEALESIYFNMFSEKIKNRLWVVKLKLNYLLNKSSVTKPIVQKNSQNNRKICTLFLNGNCRFGGKCRFAHIRPDNPIKKEKNDSLDNDAYFNLEIRFPEDNKYPYEPPYIYFYHNDMLFPSTQHLMIAKMLFEEALSLCSTGEPCLFTVISLLENEDAVKEYLASHEPQFIEKHESLFPKITNYDESLATHHTKGTTNRNTMDRASIEEITQQDNVICSRFMAKQKEPAYKRMILSRRKLPIWSRMNEILDTIDAHQVIIISGETGCGKSTQLPQFILDDWIINRATSKKHAEIICTQPRRISAIGVAERVAAERDEKIGNTVGYQIRLENKVSKWTRLSFVTTGILLQRLSGDPLLKSVSHIIVDEVHERSSESDFLLMLLKDILLQRSDLKVILMSATMKADAFSDYFGNRPVFNIPGRTFPVEQIFLEEIINKINYVLEENSKYTRKIKYSDWEQIEIEMEAAQVDGQCGVTPKNTILDENLNLAQLIGRYPGYSKQTYKNLYTMNHEVINFELLEKIIEFIVDGEHDYPKEGSILVFLPGIADITTIRDMLYNNEILSPRKGKYLIIPLHSMLSSEDQGLIFKKTKDGVRKIVLSTNIAETSVTIDDCVFVVDTGRMKETRFNSNQNMECLETCWVSRANAMQRQGRAGRVMPGISIHLFSSHRFEHHLLGQPIPEILRIPLEPLLLRISIMNSGKNVNLGNILGKVLEPPEKQSIDDAIGRLQDVGAFDCDCNLTPLGHHLAALPVDVRIGKLILYGTIFCCVDSALTMAACLSHKSPFATSFDKRYQVDAKKKEFTVAFSDQLTTLRAYEKWKSINTENSIAGQAFAHNNFLSFKTLQTLADIKHQFLELLVSIGFVPIDVKRRSMGTDKVLEMTGTDLNANNSNNKLLQGLLCAALYPNVVKIFTPEKSFHLQSHGAIPRQPKPEELRYATKKDGYVCIHPSSVNFSVGHYPSPYLVYQEKVKTSKVFIREISVVSMLPLVLFSGYGLNIEQHNGEFILSLAEGWILLAVESHTVINIITIIITDN